MSVVEQILALSKDEDYELTEAEYASVYDFINAHKDEWPWDLKEGLLKLLNGEERRTLQKRVGDSH